MKPMPKPGLMEIDMYKPGASAPEGTENPAKLSSNENPLGCSPKARAAFAASASFLHLYPDGSAGALKQALADFHHLPVEGLICGAGSDELIQLLVRAYAGPGDDIVISAYGFLAYRLAALQAGAHPIMVGEKDYTADIDALLAAVTDTTRLLFLANPNNPTGTLLPFSEIRRLRQGLRDDIILVLDAAYAEYVEQEAYDPGQQLVKETSNTVMLRTFSKVYGLAALRLGWAFCPPDIASVLERVRTPFNTNAPAQAAGLAALDDQDFVRLSVEHNTTQRVWLQAELKKLSLDMPLSFGNFLLVHFPDTPGKQAEQAHKFLAQKGLMVRPVGAYGLSHALRISIGREEENQRLVHCLDTFLSS